jgi:hypothetical protein
MNNLFNINPIWHSMAKEAIDHAKKRKSIDDYISFCQLQPRKVDQSIYDRIHIMEFLIGESIILRDGQKLRLGLLKRSKWLMEGLENGEEEAWKLAYSIDPQHQDLGKFDGEKNKEIGLRGEKFVFDELSKKLPSKLLPFLKHLSLINDSWGYDILSPSIASYEHKVFLEIKTTTRPFEEFRLFLSSNEFRVSQQSSNWYIVLVRIINGQPQIEGHFSGMEIAKIMPSNVCNRSQWNSVKIIVDPRWVKQGLPV